MYQLEQVKPFYIHLIAAHVTMLFKQVTILIQIVSKLSISQNSTLSILRIAYLQRNSVLSPDLNNQEASTKLNILGLLKNIRYIGFNKKSLYFFYLIPESYILQLIQDIYCCILCRSSELLMMILE